MAYQNFTNSRNLAWDLVNDCEYATIEIKQEDECDLEEDLVHCNLSSTTVTEWLKDRDCIMNIFFEDVLKDKGAL